MLDPMALPDQEEDSLGSTTSKPLHIQFARFVSTLLSPILVSFPAILLIAMYDQQPSSFLFAGAALFFITVGPTLYILVGVSLGKFTDIDVSVRSQRTGPFIFALISTLIGFFILEMNNAPKNLVTVMLAAFMIGLILMLITFWWKISMHASILSGSIAALAAIYGQIVWPAFLLIILVGWSRVVLKRHTTTQVIAGSLLSITLILAVIAWRGI